MNAIFRRAAAAVLLCLCAVPAQAADSINKTDIRTDPPANTDRRLRDLVWGMFERRDLRTSAPPRAVLRVLTFDTHPIASNVPNLCRYDTLWIDLAPVRHGTRDADTPVHPVSISAQSHFHFLAPPPETEADDNMPARRTLPTDGACASIDTSKAIFFNAPGESTARSGYLAFLKLQQALRDKQPVVLRCDLYPVDTQSCEQIIVGLSPAGIGNVDECDADREGECFKVEIEEREIRIILAAAGNPTMPQGRVIRASLDSEIIIADRLID